MGAQKGLASFSPELLGSLVWKKDLIPCREDLIATNDVSKRVGRYILIYATDPLILKEYGYDKVLLICFQNIHPKNKQTTGTQGTLKVWVQMVVLMAMVGLISPKVELLMLTFSKTTKNTNHQKRYTKFITFSTNTSGETLEKKVF